MRWTEVEKEWKKVFELSWVSFCEGNLPIAAIITDNLGNILSTGRNNYNISEKFLNSKVDHAETECVQMLDVIKFADVREYILYTSMEPCPMCMGTIVMGNIRKVRIAARDGWAGATDICNKSEYIKDKHIDIQFVDNIYGNIQIVFHSYVELRNFRKHNPVFKRFEEDYPTATVAAQRLYEDKVLDQCVEHKMQFEDVFHIVCRAIESVEQLSVYKLI